MNRIAKVLLFPFFAIGVWAVYALSTFFALNYLLPYSYPRTYTQMLLESIFGAIAVAIVFSVPLLKIYKNKAIVVAFFSCVLVSYLRASDIANYWSKDQAIVLMGVLEITILVGSLILGCIFCKLFIKV